jgi:hypothetical protein
MISLEFNNEKSALKIVSVFSFEVFKVTSVKMAVFLDVSPCSLVDTD